MSGVSFMRDSTVHVVKNKVTVETSHNRNRLGGIPASAMCQKSLSTLKRVDTRMHKVRVSGGEYKGVWWRIEVCPVYLG